MVMKLVRWRRFIWQLAKLPPATAALPAHYTLRSATREEEKLVQRVIFGAFSTRFLMERCAAHIP